MKELWENVEVGRVLAWVAAGLVVCASIAANGIRLASGAYEDPVLQVLLLVVELGISSFLAWGIVSGRPWARWVAAVRSAIAAGVMGTSSLSMPLIQALLPSVFFAVLWIPLLLAAVLLLFGPGVGAFFALAGERERRQTELLDELEPGADPSPLGASVSGQDRELVRCVREFQEVFERLGLEAYYRSPRGGDAAQVVEGLRRIGADHAARELAAANAVFGEDGPPREPQERIAALESLSWGKKSELGRFALALERHGESLDPLLYASVLGEEGEPETPEPKGGANWSSGGG